MKVLLCGVFWPSVGGIETLIQCIATELNDLGDRVSILSLSENAFSPSNYSKIGLPPSISIERLTGLPKDLKLISNHDICIMFGLSLKAYLPMLLSGVPTLITLHAPIDRAASWKERIKSFIVLRQPSTIACSSYVASLTGVDSVVIGGALSASFFENLSRISEKFSTDRSGLVFVGRLIRGKGCSILLDALSLIPNEIRPSLTVIGDGPEKQMLQQCSESKNLVVKFLGAVANSDLSEILSHFDILVVPSLWGEPFGMVALEGLASGCRVIAADSCGLDEACGGFARTFRRGRPESLASAIVELVENPAYSKPSVSSPEALRQHLLRYSQRAVAVRYRQEAVKCMQRSGRVCM